ncbi:hypothetical protein A4H97_04485 [Niastella yeongjuensis]|uniref:DUF3098 domain-containing protein n=1 Tax=Niastella yeongjuensis TaxID=354355 RepID=A0A1V9EY98_9BACT|nr:hypothetical protein [Niastella yeongjuensis]OQP51077.1 hypothetical protein A4H97_04485 [Niastella yeongjuensis]SEN03791.1 hypothetical protein SAMN05660816_00036 [Niastella yeongjuensis]
MAEDIDEKKQRAYVNRRSIMDLGMGIIYTGMGLLMVFASKVGLDAVFSAPFNYVFGGICLLYGGFRIYRGVRRNYYR